MEPITSAWMTATVLMLALAGRGVSQASVDQHRRAVVTAAKRLNLSIHQGILRGHRHKIPIRVRGQVSIPGLSAGGSTEVEALLPSPLPVSFHIDTYNKTEQSVHDPGTRVTTNGPLDANYWARGDAPTIQWILKDPHVVRHMDNLANRGAHIDLDGRRVRIRHHGDIAHTGIEHLERAAQLAIAVARSWQAPWTHFARLHNLRASADANRISGCVRGVYIDIRLVASPDGQLATRITIDLSSKLPGGTRMVHIDYGPSDAVPLDRDQAPMLWVSASVPEMLRRLLAQPNVVETVHDVVVGHPGSSISEAQIKLLIPGRAFNLEDAVEQAINGAEVLRDACVLHQPSSVMAAQP
jgi:hypothetical protein